MSWFIYRFTSPAMQQLFMAPRDILRIKQAVISMLAGDVFRDTPIALPWLFFKAVYYTSCLSGFSRAWASYHRREYNVGAGFSGGTKPQDHPRSI